MNKHREFIMSPISSILEDVVRANSGIGAGIETFPLCDYIMQSVFLKMTGFQEQKLKCLTWEMATNDYEYRRVLLGNNDNLGEYSSYVSKSKIYKRLIDLIRKNNKDFQPADDIDSTVIRNKAVEEIKGLFKGTNILIWNEKNFNYFTKEIKQLIKTNHFCNSDKNLFESGLQKYYKSLYSHRNRCAHNTLSYQQNLPTLSTLSNLEYLNENYFTWFTILIILDKVFISLYETYLNDLDNSLF